MSSNDVLFVDPGDHRLPEPETPHDDISGVLIPPLPNDVVSIILGYTPDFGVISLSLASTLLSTKLFLLVKNFQVPKANANHPSLLRRMINLESFTFGAPAVLDKFGSGPHLQTLEVLPELKKFRELTLLLGNQAACSDEVWRRIHQITQLERLSIGHAGPSPALSFSSVHLGVMSNFQHLQELCIDYPFSSGEDKWVSKGLPNLSKLKTLKLPLLHIEWMKFVPLPRLKYLNVATIPWDLFFDDKNPIGPVEKILQRFPGVVITIGKNESSLICVALQHELPASVIQWMLQRKSQNATFDPNAVFSSRSIPICNVNSLEALKIVVEEGAANPFFVQADGTSPLLACLRRFYSREALKYLIDLGLRPDVSFWKHLDAAREIVIQELIQSEVLQSYYESLPNSELCAILFYGANKKIYGVAKAISCDRWKQLLTARLSSGWKNRLPHLDELITTYCERMDDFPVFQEAFLQMKELDLYSGDNPLIASILACAFDNSIRKILRVFPLSSCTTPLGLLSILRYRLEDNDYLVELFESCPIEAITGDDLEPLLDNFPTDKALACLRSVFERDPSCLLKRPAKNSAPLLVTAITRNADQEITRLLSSTEASK